MNSYDKPPRKPTFGLSFDKEGHLQFVDRQGSYQSGFAVRRIFGRMHWITGYAATYPVFPALFNFWKAKAWKIGSAEQEEKIVHETKEKYPLSEDLLKVLEEKLFNTSHYGNLVEGYIRDFVQYQTTSEEREALPPELASQISKALKKSMRSALEELKVERTRTKRDVEIVKHEVLKVEVEFEDIVVEAEGQTASFLKKLRPFFDHLQQRVLQIQKWRRDGVPQGERDYEMKVEGLEPFDHQWVMYKAMRELDCSANLSDMGTGKTLACLMAIDKWIDEDEIRKGHILVVAPNTTLESAWAQQVRRFMPHLSTQLLKGSFVERLNILLNPAEERGDILLVNYEAFAMKTEVPNSQKGNGPNGEAAPEKKQVPLSKLFKTVDWDLVVLDECHKIKNPEAQRTVNILDALRGAPRKCIMSGTINANKLVDVHMPFVFLNGARNFNSVLQHRNDGSSLSPGELSGQFADAYFTRDGWKWIPRSGTVQDLRERMEEVSIRYKKEECLTLPPKTYVLQELEMSAKQAQLYNALKSHMVTSLLDLHEKGGHVTIMNILAMMTKLAEAANGWIYDDNHRAIDLPWNPKIEALKELVDDIDLEENKIVVWSRFTHDLHLIASALREQLGSSEAVCVIHGGGRCACGSDEALRASQILSFNDMGSKLRVAVVNQAVGSHGIDLVGASYECFYSNSFVKTDRIQAEDRCHRIGMRDSLTIYDLVCKETIDEQVLQALTTHKGMTTALLESLGLKAEDFGVTKSEEAPVIQIQQQKPGECLFAAVCMIAGKTQEEGRSALKTLNLEPWHGLFSYSDRLLRHWRIKTRRIWEFPKDSGSRGIASVLWSSDGKGHAVAFVGNKIYDPAYDAAKDLQKWLADCMEKGGELREIWMVTEEQF